MGRMSPLHDPSAGLTEGVSVNPTSAGAGTVNGAGVDLAGARGVTFVVQAGALTGTATVAAYLQDSADNSTFANVNTTTYTTATLAASNTANSARGMHYSHGGNRYVRAVLVRANNTALASVSHIKY